jgi:hypothetical protein
MNAIGVPTEFRLHSGERFTVKVAKKKRPDENLSDGLQQKGFELQVLAKEWRAKAPANRDPEKGDQIVTAGRRHALENASKVQYGSIEIGFVCRVVG